VSVVKVWLFTSQDVGNDVYAFLRARGDIELTVVSQRTRRDEIYGYRSTIDLCRQEGTPLHTPRSFDEDFLKACEAAAPDLILCAYYPKIFPLRLIAIPRLGCINIHPGLLPDYRGTFPTPWCILNGETEIGITLHHIDARIDTGDILVQETHAIGEHETGHALYRRAMTLCGSILMRNFDAILQGSLPRRPQPDGGSYYNRIPRQYRIDWHQPREHLRRQIRVHAKPYFPAHSFLFNKCILINSAVLHDPAGYVAQGAGVIVEVMNDKSFVVSCVDGCLHVTDYEITPLTNDAERDMHIRISNRFS
jgi:methionyl-tRNA formyltransferase